MTTEAIILMLVAMVILWGGLVLALVELRRRPERTDLPDDAAWERAEQDGRDG